MTDGTFRTWEMVTTGFGFVLFMFSMFYEDLANGHITRDANAELLLIAVIVGAAEAQDITYISSFSRRTGKCITNGWRVIMRGTLRSATKKI